jgi:hypothetical protein
MSSSVIDFSSEDKMRLIPNRILRWVKFASHFRTAHGSQLSLNSLIDREYERRLKAQNWYKYRRYYLHGDDNEQYQEDTELLD